MDVPGLLRYLSSFIFQKLSPVVWQKLKERFGPAALTLELPQPINPIGRISSANHTPLWSVRLRFITREDQPRTIVDWSVEEERIGTWQLVEAF